MALARSCQKQKNTCLGLMLDMPLSLTFLVVLHISMYLAFVQFVTAIRNCAKTSKMHCSFVSKLSEAWASSTSDLHVARGEVAPGVCTRWSWGCSLCGPSCQANIWKHMCHDQNEAVCIAKHFHVQQICMPDGPKTSRKLFPLLVRLSWFSNGFATKHQKP